MASPAWTHGLSLEVLKRRARAFRDAERPFRMGPFGGTDERAVAEAIAEERFYEGPEGVAIWRKPSRDIRWHDFAGREVRIGKDALFLDAFVPWGPAPALLDVCATRSGLGAGGRYVSIFEEDRALRSSLERQGGLLWLGTKVLATSELRSLYGAGPHEAESPLPADSWGLRCVRERFLQGGEVEAIRSELEAASLPWADHYSKYNIRHSWSAVALRGFLPSDPSFIIKPAEMKQSWKREHCDLASARCQDTALAWRFPRAMAVAQGIPGEKERVRFMRVKPGGALGRHSDITDHDAGIRPGKIARLHIPITTEPRCLFSSWTERGAIQTQHLPEGSLYYLDTRKPHAVRNSPDAWRIHFVLDVVSTPELLALMGAA